MSFRPIFLRRTIGPAVAVLATSGAVLFRPTTIYAETSEVLPSKKPIYDDDEVFPNAPLTPVSPRTPSTISKSTSPTPTERLAIQIGKSRLFIQVHVAAAETRVNSIMDSFLHLENSFTSTVASLAPSPQSGERLMPGSIYVLVAAMTGSIICRNRNILIRGTFPLAVGVGAAWVVLPVTMRNVSDLLWKYEEKFPILADSHLRARNGIENGWHMAKVHTQGLAKAVDNKVVGGREAIEGWVRKGT